MCIKVIEKYAVCGCLYHVHRVDACPNYGKHAVRDVIVAVGYACPNHNDADEGSLLKSPIQTTTEKEKQRSDASLPDTSSPALAAGSSVQLEQQTTTEKEQHRSDASLPETISPVLAADSSVQLEEQTTTKKEQHRFDAHSPPVGIWRCCRCMRSNLIATAPVRCPICHHKHCWTCSPPCAPLYPEYVRYTEISRDLVGPQTLIETKERFEEIQLLANRTREIGGKLSQFGWRHMRVAQVTAPKGLRLTYSRAT